MANIVSELQTIQNEAKGEPVREAVTNSLAALNEQMQNFSINAITSGEVYELLNSLVDVSEVRY